MIGKLVLLVERYGVNYYIDYISEYQALLALLYCFSFLFRFGV